MVTEQQQEADLAFIKRVTGHDDWSQEEATELCTTYRSYKEDGFTNNQALVMAGIIDGEQ